MKQYQGYLIDLDGTTYYGKKRITSAEIFIRSLIQKDVPFQFVTNNATRSPEQIAAVLNESYDLPVTSDYVYSSAQAMIDYLKEHHVDEKIYCIGEPPLHTLIEESGLTLVQDTSAEVVVQALNRQVDYQDLTIAVQAILNGATFITTNKDRLIPTESGLQPSSGATTAFIEYATGVTALTMGKPFTPIVEGAMDRLNLPKDQLLLIGDNYQTDIQAGINIGMDTLLVLTGVTNPEDIATFPTPPTYVVRDLSEWKNQ
ncbi:TIGR01457 family HAD-type hydrolase [Aerococcaceae bacterium DSM 111020]|nr:TIGR01457 family HAD-type hydrolase [Aerococcaceae bacterium DSM 111020]